MHETRETTDKKYDPEILKREAQVKNILITNQKLSK